MEFIKSERDAVNFLLEEVGVLSKYSVVLRDILAEVEYSGCMEVEKAEMTLGSWLCVSAEQIAGNMGHYPVEALLLQGIRGCREAIGQFHKYGGNSYMVWAMCSANKNMLDYAVKSTLQ